MNSRQNTNINYLCAQIFNAFQNTNRIRILFALKEKTSSVSELAKRINLPQPTVSRHLKILRESGMVKSFRQDKSINNALANDRVINILDLSHSMVLDRLKFQSSLIQSMAEDPKFQV
ncbi:MAG: metalloregulator ArsR/SmtB family transcription factor [Chloroflexota bacterium]